MWSVECPATAPALPSEFQLSIGRDTTAHTINFAGLDGILNLFN